MTRIATMTYNPSAEIRKVSAIKGVRAITGWGLKESKYFVDDLLDKPNTFPVPDNISDLDLSRFMIDINGSGHTISIISPNNPIRKEINKQINSVLAYASLAGQHDIVRALTSVLEAHLSFDNVEEEEEL